MSTILEIPHIDEYERFDRYVRGLKDRIHQEIEIREIDTVEEAMRVADRFDTIVYMSSSSSRPASSPSHFRRDPHPRQDRESSGPTPMDLDTIDKSKPSFKERERLRRENVCFNCRKPGHYAAKCPDKDKKDKEVSMISMI